MRRTNSDAFKLLSLNPNQNRIISTFFWLVNARIFFSSSFKELKDHKVAQNNEIMFNLFFLHDKIHNSPPPPHHHISCLQKSVKAWGLQIQKENILHGQFRNYANNLNAH